MAEKKEKLKKGLGKGLGALFTPVGDENGASHDPLDMSGLGVHENDAQEIKLRDIEPNRDQPRKVFDDERLDALASSIAMHGVVQPILVTPTAHGT